MGAATLASRNGVKVTRPESALEAKLILLMSSRYVDVYVSQHKLCCLGIQLEDATSLAKRKAAASEGR